MSLRLLSTVLLATLVSSALHAENIDYKLRSARGLAIYKDHAFASDKTAELFEYTEHREFPRVTYVTTANHARITVPAKNAEVFLLPYPGKGEATPQQAIAVLNLAQERFPQYEAQIRPLRIAWIRESRRNPTEIAQEIDEREGNRTLGESFIRWLQGLFPPRPFTPSPSPLDEPGSLSSSPRLEAHRAATPEAPAAATPSDTPTQASPETTSELEDLEKTLKQLKQSSE